MCWCVCGCVYVCVCVCVSLTGLSFCFIFYIIKSFYDDRDSCLILMTIKNGIGIMVWDPFNIHYLRTLCNTM